MKILHVIPSYIPAYSYGGPVRAIHQLCKALVKQGQEVSVFTTNADGKKTLNVGLNKETSIDGVKVTYYPLGFLKSYYYSRHMSRALKSHIEKFDIVHIHSVFLYPTLMASYWCRKKRIPYVLNPFGALDPDMIKLGNSLAKKIYTKIIERNNVRNASLVHVTSQYEKDNLRSLGFNVPTTIVPRGITMEDYCSKPDEAILNQYYPQLKEKNVLLFLGRLHPKKGLDLLAGAMERIIKERQHVYLVIAGSGEKSYEERIKKLFMKKGLADYVLFTRMVLGKERLSAFYKSRIFVLPSYGENFGMAAVEAMACGLPVIITNKVGLYTDVEEYKAGIIAHCDAKEIAEAIMRLLDREDLAKSMGENARRLVEDRFTSEKVAQRMISAYKEVIKK